MSETTNTVQVTQVQAPANIYEAVLRGIEKFGVVTAGVCVVLFVFGFAVREVYNDNKATNEIRYTEMKVHQTELMAYLTNRNDSDAKRAVSDSQLAESLRSLSSSQQSLAFIIEQLSRDAKTAHTKLTP